MAHHPKHPNRNTPPQCSPCLGELCNHACIPLALIHGNKTHMAPNLLHIVTGLQHEVRDGTGSEPPIALPPHKMGTIHCNNAHQLGVQLGCFKKKAGGVNVESKSLRVCSFSFEGARITLSATGMCFASCRSIKLTIELFLKRVLHFDWWGKSSSVNGQTLTQEERPDQSFCAADTSRCRI